VSFKQLLRYQPPISQIQLTAGNICDYDFEHSETLLANLRDPRKERMLMDQEPHYLNRVLLVALVLGICADWLFYGSISHNRRSGRLDAQRH
jgi:hypothetical protein